MAAKVHRALSSRTEDGEDEITWDKKPCVHNHRLGRIEAIKKKKKESSSYQHLSYKSEALEGWLVVSDAKA